MKIPHSIEQIKQVCIDAGHVPGANKSPCVPAYSEGAQMWALQNMLAGALEERFDDVDVFFTRERPDEILTPGGQDVFQRGKRAKGADLFVSLHSNASNNVKCDRINFVTVFYPYDGRNNSAAAADTLADAAETAMYSHVKKLSHYQTLTRQGSYGDWYGVMRGAASVGVPLYFIVEHGFHTNADNAVALLDPATLTDIAIAEALAIGEILGLHEREFVPGDVNGDGHIDARDYAMLKRYLLGTYDLTVAELARADANGDGIVNAADYATIKRKVLGTL